MSCFSGRVFALWGAGLGLLAWGRPAFGQSASFPADPPPAAPPPAAAPPPPAPPPAAAPAPAPQPYPPQPAPQQQPYPPQQQQPYAQQPYPPQQQPYPPQPQPYPPQQQQPYAPNPNAQPGYGAAYGEPPPPPAPEPEEKSSIPPFSVRLDPFNGILLGRLGLELEVGVTKWFTIETVPMFIVDDTPPLFSFTGGSSDSRVLQHSNGWGALAGATLGANFWLNGKAFKGYVIRAGITNYAISYETQKAGKSVDSLSHTERELYAMIGWLDRWGPFTLAGGFGLGYDLNKETRCFADTARSPSDAAPGDCGQLQLAASNPVNLGPIVSTTSITYPWDLMLRFSLGVTID